MNNYHINSGEYPPVGEHPPVSDKYSIQTIPQNQTEQSIMKKPVSNINIGQYKYNKDGFSINFEDIIKRGIKYLIEGFAVAFVAYYFIGKGKLNTKDIVMLGITAAFVFAILDTFSPTISLC